MRCAAAAYDILEETGIVKKRNRLGKWVTIFYPQLLRRRLLKIAGANNFAVIKTKGRSSRSWEKE
jgi:DNA-binding transcriptional regulator YhcF (GntR family)